MTAQSQASPTTRYLVKRVDLGTLWLTHNWLNLFLVLYGIWVLLPFVPPILMHYDMVGPAQVLYATYSLFCHQLPERSLFFFGAQPMYSLHQIQSVWPSSDPLVLRQFVGNAQMGWKMAWSDRMISTYGGVWAAAVLYAALRQRAPRVPFAAWILLGILPLGLDGFTHMVNDIVAGESGMGFRDTNAWLQWLTGNVFPAWFYAGNALGSFNSWARWVTGLLFGFTTVLALFPIVDRAMAETAGQVQLQLARIAARESGVRPVESAGSNPMGEPHANR